MTEDKKTWILAFAVPVGFLILTFILERALKIGCFTACEDGPVESLQALVMFVAFGLGISLLRRPRDTFPDWVRAFFFLGTIASLYIALEEISYGQRIFGWMTPETWEQINDQQETNLHNTSDWMDQKPRALLEIGAYVGGLLIPILRRLRPTLLPQKWAAVYPDGALFMTALIALLIRIWDTGTEMLGRQDLFLIDRGSELQESYFGWFILLYFIFMLRRYRAR